MTLFTLLLFSTSVAELPQEPIPSELAAQTGPYLSENISSGARLVLSNGESYDVRPDDIEKASFWITPFPLDIEASDDPDYPYLIRNLNSNVAVHAKETSQPEK